jgi:hypothetical protein
MNYGIFRPTMGVSKKVAALVLCVVGVAAASSCSSEKPARGALMLAITTDMSAPKDVDQVGLYIRVAGREVFATQAAVSPNGEVRFPATIAVLAPDDPKQPVKIRLVAFSKNKAIVLREMTTAVPTNRVAQLRIPLNFLSVGSGAGEGAVGIRSAAVLPRNASGLTLQDFDAFTAITNRCGDGKTDVGGECVTLDLSDATAFDVYDPTTIYGGGPAPEKLSQSNGDCFAVDCCFASAKILTPDGDCTVASLGPKTNIALRTNGIGTVTGAGPLIPLDFDAVAKFGEVGVSVLPNQRLQLPKAVCAKTAVGTPAAERIADILGSTVCAPKSKAMPLCGPASATNKANCGDTPDGGADATPDGTTLDPKAIELLADNLDVPRGLVASGSDVYVADQGITIKKVSVKPPVVIYNSGTGDVPSGLALVNRAGVHLLSGGAGNAFDLTVGGGAQGYTPITAPGTSFISFTGNGNTGVYLSSDGTTSALYGDQAGAGFTDPVFFSSVPMPTPAAVGVATFGTATVVMRANGSVTFCASANCKGTTPTTLFTSPVPGGQFSSLASASGVLYGLWVPADQSPTARVFRYPSITELAGSIAPGDAFGSYGEIASDGKNVYYTSAGVLFAVPVGGGTPVRIAPLAPTPRYPVGIGSITVDSVNVYWVVRGDGQGSKGAVYRRKLE